MTKIQKLLSGTFYGRKINYGDTFQINVKHVVDISCYLLAEINTDKLVLASDIGLLISVRLLICVLCINTHNSDVVHLESLFKCSIVTLKGILQQG